MSYIEDHGLPLVQLKEPRRELVVALSRRHLPISGREIAKLAALQQTIAAMEAIVDDLDAPIELVSSQRQANDYLGNAGAKTVKHIKLVFGRRKPLSLVPQHH
jgi:hypothetical protein